MIRDWIDVNTVKDLKKFIKEAKYVTAQVSIGEHGSVTVDVQKKSLLKRLEQWTDEDLEGSTTIYIETNKTLCL